jgi:hypothetical protein
VPVPFAGPDGPIPTPTLPLKGRESILQVVKLKPDLNRRREVAMASDEEGGKKHPCPDCKFCQWCSDDRCRICRPEKVCCKKKLSSAEQIALYEQLNAGKGNK